MLIISSKGIGLDAAMNALVAGGTAIDAVEAGVREVESDPREHGVGFSGYPNILGAVELDACIIDGRTLRAGAVAAFSWCSHPVSVARRIMEEMPHVLLVGDGADRFARETGFPREVLLTAESQRVWRKKILQLGAELDPDRIGENAELRRLVEASSDPQKTRDTVNFIAVDARGNIASAVSTSGWALKYPGRVGDSPLVGAGSYADNRYGAAACTGRGEMAIRAGTARSVVLYMKMGMSVEEACTEAMRDLEGMEDRFFSEVDIIAIEARGKAYGTSWNEGREFFYISDGMQAPASRPRTRVKMERRI